MAQDNRRSPRIPTDPIKVLDLAEDRIIGTLVNVSTSGLMILTQGEVPINHLFQLEMHLRFSDNSEQTIKFGAESLWSQETHTPEHEWIGFHIIDISEEDQVALEHLMEEE